MVDRVNELERRLLDKSRQGAGSSEQGSQQGEAASYTELPLAAQELMEGYTAPAGRGGLAHIKEEDASLDPRLARFLRPLTASQPPHTRDDADGEEVQLNEGANERKVEKEGIVETQITGSEMCDEGKNKTSEDEASVGGTENLIREDIEEADEEEEKETVPLLFDQHCSQNYTDDALEEIVPIDQLDAYIKKVHMKRQRKTQKGKEEEKRCVKEKKGKEEKRCVKEKKEPKANKEVVEKGRESESKQEADTLKRGNKAGERKEMRGHGEPVDDKSGVGTQEETKGAKSQMEGKMEGNTMTTEKGTKMVVDTATSVKNIDDEEEDDESFDLDLSDYDSDNDKLDLALEEWRNDCGGGKLAGEPTSPAKGEKRRAKGGKREGFRLWRKEPKESNDDVELPSALQALLDKATAAATMDGGGSDSSSGWTM